MVRYRKLKLDQLPLVSFQTSRYKQKSRIEGFPHASEANFMREMGNDQIT